MAQAAARAFPEMATEMRNVPDDRNGFLKHDFRELKIDPVKLPKL